MRLSQRPHRPSRLCHALSLTLLILAAPAHSQSVEEIFAAARDYTVYIETRIETPFIEDDPGSYLGAGFIVDRARGWVMTNAHVIGHSPAQLEVSFADGAKSRATPVYIDSFLDLALVRIDADATRSRGEAQLDCAARPAVGVPVGAYGHPSGYRFTGTRGIVSGFSKRTETSLQTDAPINAGNSGGPLIRLDTGQVVGINAASLGGEHVQNMNFAVEMRYACRVLELLRRGEDPRPVVMDALFYTQDDEPTLTVAHVGASAAALGLQPGDSIVAVNGSAIEPASLGELMHRLRGVHDAVELQVRRADGDEIALRYPMVPDASVMARRGVLVGGVLFAPTRYQDADLLADRPKLMAHFVASGSQGQSAGLAPFDQLVAVNGRPIDDIEQLADFIEHTSEATADFEVIRLVPNLNRFTRYIRASLSLERSRWVQLQRNEDAIALERAQTSGQPQLSARFASVRSDEQ